MLNRHNSMSGMHHQPIMPFKWRPFDMYNDIHVTDLPQSHDTCERLTSSNCMHCCCQCEHSDHHHHHHHVEQDQQQHNNTRNNHVMMCNGNVKEQHRWSRRHRHRHSSRGSSSGSGGSSGSCASLSTIGRYYVNDIDNSESSHMDTSKSCGSVDCFCCNGQRNLTNDKINNSANRYHHQQQPQQHNEQQYQYQHSDCSICYNEITISKCCTPNCRYRSSKHTSAMSSSNKNDMNRSAVMPFDSIDFTYKCERAMIGTLNHCENESPSSPIAKINANLNGNIESTTVNSSMRINHCKNANYFDNNWMIVQKNRPHADSKYIFDLSSVPLLWWQQPHHVRLCKKLIRNLNRSCAQIYVY